MVRDQLPGWQNIRLALLIGPGGLGGAYSAGQAIELLRAGFGRIFKTIACVSTGCGVGSYFASGLDQCEMGSQIYVDPCTRRNFCKFTKSGPIMDLDYLMDIMRTEYPLNEPEVKRYPGNIYFQVTKLDGQPHFVNAKTAHKSLFSAMSASMCAPHVTLGPKRVNGFDCCDGATRPYPINELELLSEPDEAPTHVIVLPSQHHKSKKEVGLTTKEMLLLPLMIARFGLRLAKAFNRRHEHYLDIMSGKRTFRPKVHFFWPKNVGLDFLTRDKKLLQKAISEARQAIKLELESAKVI